MKFSCDTCQTKYTIPDDKVRGKVLKIRCKKCNAVVTVKEEPAPAATVEEQTRVADAGALEKLRQEYAAAEAPPEPAPPSIEWYAMIGGKQAGPLSPEEVRAKVESHEVGPRTHVWRDTMGDWMRASEVAELAPLFAPASLPPPLPKASAPAPPVAEPAAPPDEGLDEGPGEGLSGALFDDADSGGAASADFSGESTQIDMPMPSLADLVASEVEHAAPKGASQPAADPFAHVPDAPHAGQPQIGEQTRFFMKQAGVTNRNPWWKIALFVLAVVAFPVAIVYGLGKSGVGGQVIIVDAQGNQRAVPRFSAEGIADVTGLGKLLLGKHKGAAAEVAAVPAPRPHRTAPKPTADEQPAVRRVGPDAGLSKAEAQAVADQYKALDLEGPVGHAGPVERKQAQKVADVDTGSGLSQDQIGKVVSANMPAFGKCVENELRRNPGFRGGRINISWRIKSSGVVVSPAIDRAEIDNSQVGECIKLSAKRMVFPAFEGEDQPVEVPFLLTNGG